MAIKPLPYVKAYVDRHGKARHYFRRKGFVSMPLPAPGSPGFMEAYEAANAAPATTTDRARVRFLPGSLGWAVEQFLSSDEFDDRADKTRLMDRRIFDQLRASFGAGMLRDLRDRSREDHTRSLPATLFHVDSGCRH
jgi:hypothetical protein